MIPDRFLQDLKYRNDIEDIISSYVTLKRAGRNIKGLCPFHSEKTPSFTVYPGTQSFYCFGCGAGGDVIKFIENIENLDYVGAVHYLANRAGMDVPDEDGKNDKDSWQKKTRVLEINRETARFFHSCLKSPQGKQALDYLLNRGLTSATITKFGLGYAPNSWDTLVRHLKEKGFSEQDMCDSAVVSRGKGGKLYDEFRNRVMFPIIDMTGAVIGFSGRQLDNNGPKYLNSPDTIAFKKSRNLFAFNFAKSSKTRSFILCEGNMDVISLHQAGFTNAVAALGTALTSEQARLLSRYCDEIILAYDSDEAGIKATKRARTIIDEVGIPTKVIKIENAKDPDEYIKKFGATRFKLLIEGSQSALDFEIAKIKDKYDINEPSSKSAYIKEVVLLLSTLTSDIDRGVYISTIAAQTEVSKTIIENEINKIIQGRNKKIQIKQQREMLSGIDKNVDKINPERSKNIKAANAEENLIVAIYKNPDFLQKIENEISSDDFVTEFGKKLFSILSSLIKQQRPLDLSLIIKEFDTAQSGYITKMFNLSQNVDFDIEMTKDFVATVKTEKEKKAIKPISDMTEDEYADLFAKMKERKK
ncbi:MAG: DNA primase [Oscillospiraceae bacterium]|nr:DNA primase [Oscillospiraceae bacterium]